MATLVKWTETDHGTRWQAEVCGTYVGEVRRMKTDHYTACVEGLYKDFDTLEAAKTYIERAFDPGPDYLPAKFYPAGSLVPEGEEGQVLVELRTFTESYDWIGGPDCENHGQWRTYDRDIYRPGETVYSPFYILTLPTP